MDKTKFLLTKTCIQCGQSKPLSAFLEMTGQEGTTYGNVCTSCRRAEQEDKSSDLEGSATSGTALRIDAKTKVQDAIERRQQREHIEEVDKEERLKQTTKADQKQEKKTHQAEEQRKHREGFLARRPFVEKKEGGEDPGKWLVGGETRAAKERAFSGTSGPFKETFGKAKTNSVVFLNWLAGLGENSPAKKMLKATYEKKVQAAAEATKKEDKTAKKENKSETLSEYVEKNWGPGRKRS